MSFFTLMNYEWFEIQIRILSCYDLKFKFESFIVIMITVQKEKWWSINSNSKRREVEMIFPQVRFHFNLTMTNILNIFYPDEVKMFW